MSYSLMSEGKITFLLKSRLGFPVMNGPLAWFLEFLRTAGPGYWSSAATRLMASG